MQVVTGTCISVSRSGVKLSGRRWSGCNCRYFNCLNRQVDSRSKFRRETQDKLNYCLEIQEVLQYRDKTLLFLLWLWAWNEWMKSRCVCVSANSLSLCIFQHLAVLPESHSRFWLSYPHAMMLFHPWRNTNCIGGVIISFVSSRVAMFYDAVNLLLWKFLIF